VKPRPIRLKPDNFTPPTRTPWGGTELLSHYKAELGIQSIPADMPVGESWELSASEEFHSVTEAGERLGALLEREPLALLGDEARAGQKLTALLVKWLDAGDNLSLQIHPEDDYAGLTAGETGKLEAWYVVGHKPGAGIYLGFRPGVGEPEIRAALTHDSDLRALMRFVKVQRGDFILLEPGTPHAVGKGITLIEPQTVTPGRRGVTYRYWDFGRRYDASGKLDPAGRPRELHVQHALAVTRWERANDEAWLASRQLVLGWPDSAAPARCELLCAPQAEARLRSARLRVARLFGTGTTQLPAWNALRAVTVVEGEVRLGAGTDAILVPAGTTVAVPAVLGALETELAQAHALISAAAVPG
jgi:mannose-6-phosphate isomerase class I